MSDVKLLSCPFCGSDSLSTDWSWVTCKKCDADGPCEEEPREAIAAWNTRSPDPLTQQLAEALEGAIAVLHTIEAKTLVGDEGCIWPAEAARAALAAYKAVRP